MNAVLPFRPFARERLVLALIALSVVGIVQFPNTQDKTRLSLAQAMLEHGDVTIERYGTPFDRAKHGRHLYTDKAPGLSLVALPAVAAVRAADWVLRTPRARLVWQPRSRLAFIRLVVLMPFLLLLAWLVGRTAEGLVVRTGAVAAVATALATMLGALSSVLFAHVAEACLGFAAFVVVARGRGAARAAGGGALAGTAVLMDYEGALLVLALGLYVAALRDRTAIAGYVLGILPPAAVLGVYDAVAFGSPLRLSYRYKVGPNAGEQSRGFFGIGRPRLDSLVATLGGHRGLLRISPVLAAAAFGLVLLWRRGLRREAGLAVSVIVLYLALEAGYFDPFGGTSPGPRFLAPAIPFLLLGLPLVLEAAPLLVGVLLLVSVAASTWDALTWFTVGAWPKTIFTPLGAPRLVGVALVATVPGAALLLALTLLGRRRSRMRCL